MQPPYLYDAYAVMRHHGGTLGGGHYTALCRDPGRNCWRLYNDSRVDDVDVDQKKAMMEAYVVFFERVSMPDTGML
jgi:ubiquitin carboxyl-terminal hydrolase 8